VQSLNAPLPVERSALANVVDALAGPSLPKLPGRRSKHASDEGQGGDNKVEEAHFANSDRGEIWMTSESSARIWLL
jgi:hypothetical protein